APPEIAAGPPRFIPGVPVGIQIEQRISAKDPTSQAILRQKLEAEARRQLGAHPFGRRNRW
ncbi:MAG: hypothetical protein WBU20_00845, partial [Candidatus Acidiferrum sp.]